MLKDSMELLRGQVVEVVYNSIVYRGTLQGADENDIYLQTPTDWVTLPLEGISDIRKAPE